MALFNFFTCENFQVFDDAVKAGVTRSCNLYWTLDVALFFIIIYLPFILRKQCADGMLAGTNFNHILSLIVGIVATLVGITIFGEPRWALIIGLAGVLAGGFGGGLIASTSEDYVGGGGDYTG